MFTLKRLGRLGVITAVLTAGAVDAVAVPIFEAPPQWRAERPGPPAPAAGNCAGQQAAAPSPHAPATGNSDAPRYAPHGGEKADLDGYTSRCRLVDAEHDSQEPLNDGIDPKDLLKLLEQLDGGNRALSAEEEQALFERLGGKLQIQFDSTDQQLHAYLGDGAYRQDLGQLSLLGIPYLAGDGVLVPHEGYHERYAQAEQQLRNALGGASPMGLAAAIPEPGTYAMLLAGLAVILLMRRRKGGAGQRN